MLATPRCAEGSIACQRKEIFLQQASTSISIKNIRDASSARNTKSPVYMFKTRIVEGHLVGLTLR
jgi:hypothetical protein